MKRIGLRRDVIAPRHGQDQKQRSKEGQEVEQEQDCNKGKIQRNNKFLEICQNYTKRMHFRVEASLVCLV